MHLSRLSQYFLGCLLATLLLALFSCGRTVTHFGIEHEYRTDGHHHDNGRHRGHHKHHRNKHHRDAYEIDDSHEPSADAVCYLQEN